jgi:hypothetical protein
LNDQKEVLVGGKVEHGLIVPNTLRVGAVVNIDEMAPGKRDEGGEPTVQIGKGCQCSAVCWRCSNFLGSLTSDMP